MHWTTMRTTIRLAIALLLASLIGCGEQSSNPGADANAVANPDALQIAVIPKGTTHVFWKSVEAGARKAGQELGVNILWKGPLKENDRAQQIGIVEQFVSDGVSGIALAPLDAAALVGPVASATSRNIPVVIFDSALAGEPGKDHVSLVATNNKEAGKLGGKHLAELLGGKGKVALLRYQEGSASTMDREAGFLEALADHPDIEVIVDNRYGGATMGEALQASLNMLDKLREADGIFCPNESTTFGMLQALRQSGLIGTKKFVGFDTSPPLLEALRNSEIDALVAQNPTHMGYTAVKTLVAHIRGESVEPVIDTGAALVTRDNLDTAEIKALLGE